MHMITQSCISCDRMLKPISEEYCKVNELWKVIQHPCDAHGIPYYHIHTLLVMQQCVYVMLVEFLLFTFLQNLWCNSVIMWVGEDRECDVRQCSDILETWVHMLFKHLQSAKHCTSIHVILRSCSIITPALISSCSLTIIWYSFNAWSSTYSILARTSYFIEGSESRARIVVSSPQWWHELT